MADGAKQYEIVFLLKAALDSSMQQFSAMGGKMRELEQKVQQYQQTIGKIEALQKQKAEVQKLEQEYAKTRTQLEGATQKFNEATAAVKTANQAVEQHKATVQSLELKIKEEEHAHELNIQKIQEESAVKKLIAQEDEKHRTILTSLNQEKTREIQAMRESKAALDEAKAAEQAAIQQKAALKAAAKEASLAYQQHKANVQDLTAKIKEENDSHNLLIQKLREEGADEKLVAQEKERHKAAIASLTQERAKEKQAMRESKATLEATKAAEKEAKQRKTELTAAVKEAERTYRQHQETIKSLNKQIQEEGQYHEANIKKLQEEDAAKKLLTQEDERHKAAIAALNQEKQKETQAIKESEAALKRAQAAEREAQKQKNAMQNASDRAREKLERERNALQQTTEALRKMGVGAKNAEVVLKYLKQAMRENTEELERFAAFKNNLNTLADQFMVMNTAARAVLPTLNKVNDFFKDSIALAGELEFKMSSVEAISGASASDMEKLTAVAKEMGATTRYTALDAANALQQMALAGWEAEGMVAALPGVVNLAASANEELSDMTRILVDGMNAFGMSGTENARKFADVLAKSATSSSTNVAQLGRALEACQGTAGNLGYAIEDVGTVLAGMANNGIKASVAGTALNALLTRLSGGVQKAEKTMRGMGVSMYYASDAFGHAEGEAKPLLEFINELREAFKQFGDNAQEAQVAAYTLAGMRGMKGLLSITNMSDEAWQKLCDDISQYAGAAEEISGISMDNYRGQLYLLTSAWDALKTSVGEKFLPTAKESLRVLTDFTTGADKFVQSHGNLVRFVAGFTASLAGLLTLLTAIAGAIQLVRIAVNTLALGKLLAVVGGFGGLVAVALAAGVAFAALTAEQEKELEASRKLVKQNQELSQSYENACAEIEENRGSVENLVAELNELSKKEEKSALDKQRIQKICEELNGSLPDLALSYDKESDSLKGLTGSLDDYVKSLYDAQRMEADVSQMSTLYGAIRNTSEQLEIAKEKLAEWERILQGATIAPGSILSGEEAESIAMTARYRAVVADLERQLQEAKDAYDALLKKYGETPEKVNEAAKGASDLRNVFTRVQNQLQALQEAYDEAYESAAESVQKQYKLWDEVGEVETKSIKEINEAIKEQLESWKQYQKDLEYLGSLSPDIPGLSEALKMLSDGTEESRAYARELAAEAEKGNGKVYELAQSVGELSQIQSDVTGTMAEAATGFDATMAGIVDTVRTSIEEMNQDEAAAISAKSTMEAFLDNIESYNGPIGNAVGAISDIVVSELNKINEKLHWMEVAASRAKQLAAQSSNAYLSTAALRTATSATAVVKTANTPVKVTAKGWDMSGRYATGTLSAPSGMALVGEQGPELVYMRGGETVLTAAETRRLRIEAQLLQKAMPDSVRMTGSHSDRDSGAEFALFYRNVETVRLLEQAIQKRAPVTLPGYASGTLNAAPGAAVVGERGPELMLMRGGERVIPATETAQRESIPASRAETVQETSRVIRAISEKTANMEREVYRTIRVMRESAENRTTVRETLRVLQAFRETERAVQKAEMSRTSERESHIVRTTEQRVRNIRTQDEVSRIVRIFREATGSRAEATERTLRTSERNASILREAATERTSERTVRMIQVEAERVRNVLRDSEITRTLQTLRETDYSESAAESRRRIITATESKSSRLIRELETGREDNSAVQRIRTRSVDAASQFFNIARILQDSGDAKTQTALRILREKETVRNAEAERERRRQETYPYGAASGFDSPDIASYGAYRGGGTAQGGGDVTVNLSVEYNIDGGGNLEGLREALRSNDREVSELVERAVRKVIRQDEENRRRRALA